MSKAEIAKLVLENSITKLSVVLNEAGVPDSHGMGHCTKVLEHMHRTLESAEKAFACSYYFDLSEE